MVAACTNESPTTVFTSTPTVASEFEPRRLTIAGKIIELPADVEVDRRIGEILCVQGTPCPIDELPFIILRRGESRADVSEKTGRIVFEKIAPGDEGAFAFIREAFPQ